MKLTALALAILTQASTPNASQFDLLCEGYTKRVGGRAEAYQFRYVVDLVKMQWCKNAAKLVSCPRVHQIVRVDETRYTFRESERGEPANFDYVDRQTSKSFSLDRRLGYITEGDCERAEFSGFPQPQI
jgi:hypothetical protein